MPALKKPRTGPQLTEAVQYAVVMRDPCTGVETSLNDPTTLERAMEVYRSRTAKNQSRSLIYLSPYLPELTKAERKSLY